MPRTSTNIRIDKEIKEKAQEIFSELGMDLTTGINLFLRQVVINQGIPFALKLDHSDKDIALKEGDTEK